MGAGVWPAEDPALAGPARDWWLSQPETVKRLADLTAQMRSEQLKFDVEGMNRMFRISQDLEAAGGPIGDADGWPGWSQ